jgi:hypothetical protein
MRNVSGVYSGNATGGGAVPGGFLLTFQDFCVFEAGSPTIDHLQQGACP